MSHSRVRGCRAARARSRRSAPLHRWAFSANRTGGSGRAARTEPPPRSPPRPGRSGRRRSWPSVPPRRTPRTRSATAPDRPRSEPGPPRPPDRPRSVRALPARRPVRRPTPRAASPPRRWPGSNRTIPGPRSADRQFSRPSRAASATNRASWRRDRRRRATKSDSAPRRRIAPTGPARSPGRKCPGAKFRAECAAYSANPAEPEATQCCPRSRDRAHSPCYYVSLAAQTNLNGRNDRTTLSDYGHLNHFFRCRRSDLADLSCCARNARRTAPFFVLPFL